MAAACTAGALLLGVQVGPVGGAGGGGRHVAARRARPAPAAARGCRKESSTEAEIQLPSGTTISQGGGGRARRRQTVADRGLGSDASTPPPQSSRRDRRIERLGRSSL